MIGLQAEKFRTGSWITLTAGIIGAILVGWATASLGMTTPLLLIALAGLLPMSVWFVYRPAAGFSFFVIYSFFIAALGRFVANLPFVYGVEFTLLLVWIGVISAGKVDKKLFRREIVVLGLVWFGITVLELLNPAAGSFLGWVSDARYPLLWVLSVPLCLVLFNSEKHLNRFLLLIISISLLAALYGIKQLKIGLNGPEEAFIISSPTHWVAGKLRVFSFYADAGQFGASMAHLAVISIILAMGPYRWWKRFLLLAAAAVFIYGMLISGTRGALFAFLVGMLIALFITKNIKVMIMGLMIVVGSFVFLKYTDYFQSNAQIRRMRTALDPTDPSLNVRLNNQEKLAKYLSSRPIGGGIGAIGYAGVEYNKGSYLASIPPDSYWVKVWAMYGIVGLVIWFGIMMYIIGKSCGIVWKLKNKHLRFKLGALTAGAAGIFACSYGNEVMNNYPSAMIVYLSWAFVFMGPALVQHAMEKRETTEGENVL